MTKTIGDLHKEAGVDDKHLRGGKEIKKLKCTGECGRLFDSVDDVEVESTLGTWGPNGNGRNYWCPNCESRLNPEA